MAVTSPPPMRTTREPQWTPRQRQVLDLLVRGRTNSEIAQDLGVSLDGAKWHVSEIITKLGVDSRDEAAEYWRHHNGLRMRFTRVMHSIFGSATLKFAGAAAALVGVVVAGAMVIFALNNADEGTPQAGEPTPPSTSTPDPTAQPTGTPPPTTPTVDPGNLTGEVVLGVPVRAVTIGDAATLPNTSYIVEKGCWQCDGEATSYERVSFAADGTTSVETIFEAPEGFILGGRFAPNGGTHFVSVCTTGYCGGVGEMSADATTTLYRSNDDGETWDEIGEYPGSAIVLALETSGPILLRQEVNLGPTSVERLDGTAVAPPEAEYEPYGYRGLGFVWQAPDRQALLMPDGSPIVSGDLGGHRSPNTSFQFISLLPDGSGALVSWFRENPSGGYVSYLGVFRNGQLERVFETGETPFAGAWLSQTTYVGNMAMNAPAGSAVPGGQANQPVVFDIETGAVTPLALFGPLFTADYTGRNNVVAAAVAP